MLTMSQLVSLNCQTRLPSLRARSPQSSSRQQRSWNPQEKGNDESIENAKDGQVEGHGEKYTSDHEEDKPYVPQAAHFLTAVSVSLPLTLYASVPDPLPRCLCWSWGFQHQGRPNPHPYRTIINTTCEKTRTVHMVGSRYTSQASRL